MINLANDKFGDVCKILLHFQASLSIGIKAYFDDNATVFLHRAKIGEANISSMCQFFLQ